MDINNFDLLELQTAYLQQDPTIQALCLALTPYLQEISKNIEQTFIYGRIDELSEEAVDELAWQFHVDFYDSKLPIEKKRNLVKKSPMLHKIKGTPQAVIDAVETIFGRTKLKEWFEYGGKPYFFGLDIDITEHGANEENMKMLDTLIRAYKNKRSWIEYIHICLTNQSKIFYGTALLTGEKVTVYPYTPNAIETKGQIKIAMGQNTGAERVTILPLGGTVITNENEVPITTEGGQVWTMEN